MTLTVLINAAAVYTGKEIIRDSYVYIEDGIIRDVGPQPAPDDIQDATLVIGGEGRVVVPGLTAVADVAAYPIRYTRPSLAARIELYRRLKDEELFTASLPGVYELHMMGVTTALVESLSSSLALDLARRIGGFYGVARPSCTEAFSIQPILRGLVTIGSKDCPGGQVEDGDRGHLVLTGRGGYGLEDLDDVLSLSQSLRKLAGLEETLIEPNRPAEVAVYDASKPPAMLIYKAGEDEIRRIYTSHATLESLIAGMDVLVEMGEHMRIGRKHLNEAAQLYRRLGYA
ncbi:hypothetical protein [Acidilobus sp.]|uniref:hypothetical protein n=1 Tax=Acidilobus sp. TaxID=1872109 RepID=UPI003D08C32A